ncbi:hypothetical protein GW17_00060918 [Ensete ventricosum]|nr:hypothetical protein GW17_00060918 [Ensete ventricosum]
MEVSPECGERLPTGKSVGVSEVENEDIEEPIPGQRETKRERVREGLVLGDAPVVSAFGWLFRAAKRVAAMEHSRALRLQGRRPLVPMCRSVGEAAEISLLRRKKGCQGCGNSISARWEIGADLVGSVSR